jgi:hypothetical protein
MPDADLPTPLCGAAAFTEGAFADLVAGFSQTAINDILAEATRQCEDQAGRRLAPFTGVTETIRASGIDPDEYAGTTNIPVSIQGTLGMSLAGALNMTNLVRHCWLGEYPPRYPDLWLQNPAITVTVIRSYGGTQQLSAGQILDGPDNTGHVWFQLGQFIPEGSRLRVTYPGGYSTTPASLLRACKFIAASIAIDELNPEARGDAGHNPDRLFALGLKWLKPFMRDGGDPKL